MSHNIYHLDGKGTLRHLDRILEVAGNPGDPVGSGHGQGYADSPMDAPAQANPGRRENRSWSTSRVDELDEFIGGMEPRGALPLPRRRARTFSPTIIQRVERR